MKRLLENKNFIIKWGLLVLFFVLGYLYENPQGDRKGYLLGFFALLMMNQFLSIRYKSNLKKQLLFFSLMILSVIAIEEYTSYVMNYFFHLLYVVLLIDALLSFPQKLSWGIGASIVLLSLRKYIYLYNYQKKPETFAEIVFFVLLTLIIFIASSFSRYYQDEKNEKEILYRQMLGKNEALRLYSEKVASLSITEERTRIARDLHDQLGHQLTGLVMELEMIDHLTATSKGKEKELIMQAKDDARETLKMVRNIVEQFKETEEIETEDGILKMIEEFKQRTFIQVGFTKVDIDDSVPWLLLKQLIKEALTNAARYSTSDSISINLTQRDRQYVLRIFNEGHYNSLLNIGNGIRGMKDRLMSVGGKLEINLDSGFEILCWIPQEEKNDKNITG